MSAAQQNRYRELDELPHRTEDQELEWLTLAWFTDHSDPVRGWRWAAKAAQQRRPVNYTMNRELCEESASDPLDLHLDELSACLPPHVEILGGADDPRPLSALESLAVRLDVRLTRIDGAGHEPWLEQPDVVRAHVRRFVRDSVGP